MSTVKIVATIGPASRDPATLRALFEAGASVFRLNGSHVDLAWHGAAIRAIRETVTDVPILLDVPGRKIRTGQLAAEPSFQRGDTLVLTTDQGHDGSEKVPIEAVALQGQVPVGATVLADDGTLTFTVVEASGNDLVCRAETAGTLRSRKGINIPNIPLGSGTVPERDRAMIQFATDNGVDFVGVSFVESAAHVEAVRALAGGGGPRIIAKIENNQGMENLGEIVEAADALMIDRGDLSAETALETLGVFQKQIIGTAQALGKPAIVATEMLHSMIERSQPTKAEVSDITNAVLDGCAATMLSGETAIGVGPVAAVSVMRRILDAAAQHQQSILDERNGPGYASVPQAAEDAVSLICRNLAVTKIVAVTISGYAARMVAARRPRQPILAVSNDPMAARSFNLLAGVEGVHVDIPFPRNSTDHIAVCLEDLWRRGKLDLNDLVLVTAVGYPRSGNRMNLIQTHYVADLHEALNWDQRQTPKVVAGTGGKR